MDLVLFQMNSRVIHLWCGRDTIRYEPRLRLKKNVLWQLCSILLTFRVLNDMASSHSSKLLNMYNPKRALRSSSQMLLVQLRSRLKRRGDYALQLQRPRLWTNLPFFMLAFDSSSVWIQSGLFYVCFVLFLCWIYCHYLIIGLFFVVFFCFSVVFSCS